MLGTVRGYGCRGAGQLYNLRLALPPDACHSGQATSQALVLCGHPSTRPRSCVPREKSLTLIGFLLFLPVLQGALLSTLKLHAQLAFGRLLGSLGARGPLPLATSTPFV